MNSLVYNKPILYNSLTKTTANIVLKEYSSNLTGLSDFCLNNWKIRSALTPTSSNDVFSDVYYTNFNVNFDNSAKN